jgi:serine/threonine-protein kinase
MTVRRLLLLPGMQAQSLEVGEYLGDSYLVCGELARRGTHRLYEADDVVLGRRVAIEVADDAAALTREAKALAAVRHPGTPAVYGVGSHRGISYMAMERLAGVTLADLIEERRHAPDWFHLSEIVPVLTALAEVLDAVHAAGMAYGALSPEVVMICAEERVVLVDFGAVVAPPEVAAEDTRAFGRVAYELFIGEPPASDDADIAAIRPDVPTPLADLLQACLAAQPGDRPSMADVVDHLRALPRRRAARATR